MTIAPRRARVAAVAVMLGLAAPAASAQELVWIPRTVAPAPTAQDPDPAPSIQVKVIGELAPEPDQLDRFELLQLDGGRPPGVRPTAVVPYHESDEPLALVVLVEGHELYMGNDSYAASACPADAICEEVSRTAGAHAALALALGGPDDRRIPTTMAKAGPPGSQGALLVYGDGVDVRHPMRPLAELTGDKLGAQERQRGVSDRDLFAGLRAAHALLAATQARRVLIVISDGVDPSVSPDEIRAVRNLLLRDRIDLYILSLRSSADHVGDPMDVRERGFDNLRALGTLPLRALDGRDLAGRLADVVTAINSRFWLHFPGQAVDAVTGARAGFTWDGREHELALRVDDEELEPRTVLMTPRFGRAPSARWWRWWLVMSAAGVVIAAAALLLWRRLSSRCPRASPSPP